MKKNIIPICVCLLITAVSFGLYPGLEQEKNLDPKVQKFLEEHRNQWWDLNVPESDGKILHDLILKHRYKKALEIGTSTGRSAIWIAWALSKTGGRLITIDIDENRYKEALANFREAGLSGYIDARLADAHELVPALTGTFDFVFCDADKEWYPRYLKDAWPKLETGGCFTAHNIMGRIPGYAADFLGVAEALPDAVTTIDTSGGRGISITYKKAVK